MPEVLNWMFKVKDFKKHFIFVACFNVIIWILAWITLFSVNYFQEPTIKLALQITSFALFIIPILFLLGYFWELTDAIINREWDIKSANVYNNKIKTLNKISLPEIRIIKFIWRGIASITASALLAIPIILLVLYNLKNTQLTLEFFELDSLGANIFYSSIYLFVCSFIPALAWNYARRDSVVAVWNIPKAVFIMGNYPFLYWKNTVLFIIFTLLNGFLISNMLNISLNDILNVQNYTQLSFSFSAINITEILAVYLLNIYLIYVNAFLIGTLTPAGENY